MNTTLFLKQMKNKASGKVKQMARLELCVWDNAMEEQLKIYFGFDEEGVKARKRKLMEIVKEDLAQEAFCGLNKSLSLFIFEKLGRTNANGDADGAAYANEFVEVMKSLSINEIMYLQMNAIIDPNINFKP